MRKRIPLNELAVGMYVTRLDKRWMDTPLLTHHMRIKDAAQLATLRACGVRYVEIDTEKGATGTCSEAVTPVSAETLADRLRQRTEEVRPAGAQGSVPTSEQVSFEDELPAAREVYQKAKAVIQQALQDVRMGREIHTDAVGKVVDRLADSVLRNPDSLTSLSRIKRYDEYTFFHSVNTAVLSLALGQTLGMDRGALHHLGMGALLHDVGKMRIPVRILNKPGRLKDAEFEIVKQHALRGAEILSRTTRLEERVIQPALEHHERIDGTGYPFGKQKDTLSQFGLISSVVDIYDAITSDRVYHKAIPPYEAVKYLWLYRLSCG